MGTGNANDGQGTSSYGLSFNILALFRLLIVFQER